MTGRAGRAYLVGAGPGDPGLITRRGLELLRSCDVVLFDRLAAPQLLDEAPDHAERISVGKSSTSPSMPQAEIDALIVNHARSGKVVVRLKGGDPFVFGRGADEGQALAAAGIPFEIVPGVTSAVSVPAYAGIPLTHSGVSSSFTVLTAHESSARPEAQERWDHVALGADTLVLLMGVGSIRDTTRRIIEAGRDPAEPCAVVERGTTTSQRVVVGTLDSIADLVTEAELQPPAITVVGPVVRLRPALDWFESRPLFGRRVAVTRARGDASRLGVVLEEAGAEVVFLPTIRIDDPPSWDELDGAITDVATGVYDWIAFSSAHGVEGFFTRLAHAGSDARALASTKVAAVGPATAAALEARGVRPDLVPDAFTGAALAESLGAAGGTVLLPRPLDAPRDMVEILEGAGWKVSEVAAYVTVPVPLEEDDLDAIRDRPLDAITFASASSARNFVAALGKHILEGTPSIVCIGPVTSDAAIEAGLRVDGIADEHTLDGLVRAVIECVGR